MKRSIILFLFLISSFVCNAQHKSIYPEMINLQELPPFTLNSNIWHELNSSPIQYKIMNDGSVVLEKEEFRSLCSLDFGSGILIGIDSGEWGGGLLFYSKNKSGIMYEILNENVKFIVLLQKHIYILSGLCHLNIDKGKIQKIEDRNNKWQVTENIELPGAPETYVTHDSGIYIITCGSLCVFNGKELTIVLKKQSWSSLYPSSAKIFDNKLIIGMRGCLAIYSIEDKKVKYYR